MALLRRVIGAVLRRVRQHQGRTLRDVAEAAGVSLPYLSEVERGTKEASSEVLAAICRALGLPMPDLLDEVRKELLRDAPAPRAATPPFARLGTPSGPHAAALPGPRAAAFAAAGSPGAGSAASGQTAAYLRLRCITERSGGTGSGTTPTVRYGRRGGAPRCASRLRLSGRPLTGSGRDDHWGAGRDLVQQGALGGGRHAYAAV